MINEEASYTGHAFFLLSCGENQDETLCTDEFRIIEINVFDVQGRRVKLDDFQVIDVDDNSDITAQVVNEFLVEPGFYPIATDATSFNGKERLNLLLIGY